MSTSPYSLDLSERVIKFVKSGGSQRLAAQVFSISKTTVNLWHVRYKREGNYTPKSRLGAKSKISVPEFIKYIEDHPSSTVQGVGKVFNMTGAGVHYWLKKLNFSYKKKTSPTWKRI